MIPHKHEEQEFIVTDCLKRKDTLTAWELGFCKSIKDYLDKNVALTRKQDEILTKIWNRVTDTEPTTGVRK
jgi:flagellar motor component MotA